MATMASIARSLRDTLDPDLKEQMASAIPSETDLADEGMVIKALSNAGYRCCDFYPWLDEITDRARAIYFEERTVVPCALAAMAAGIGGFFAFVPPVHAAIVTPEGAAAYSKLGAAGIVALGVIAASAIIIWALNRIPVGPIIGDDDHGPEPTREQRARDAEGQAEPIL